MGKIWILQRPNGHQDGPGVTVVVPAEAARRAGESDVVFYARVLAGTLAKNPHLRGLLQSESDSAQLPSNRFRDAWRMNDVGVLRVDLPVARSIRLGEIRKERDTKLAESDGLLLREQEQNGPQVNALKAYRQSLRDLPASVTADLAALDTPDKIELYVPSFPVKP